jgi:2-polyprenyl-3-methyl-5-hydroxy-6-metoxy-1,4-benzoquinol methylase
MDNQLIRDFWRQRAAIGTTRWTGNEIFDFELMILNPYASRASSILDLGCGFGELSRALSGSETELIGVDFEPAYEKTFTAPNHKFSLSDVRRFDSRDQFDLTLLFGVVTHLTLEEEESLYLKLSKMRSQSGVVVVKNQCSSGEEFIFEGYSDVLGAEYVGRYPKIESQEDRLSCVFSNVDVRRYPERFRFHQNSEHVMFICC